MRNEFVKKDIIFGAYCTASCGNNRTDYFAVDIITKLRENKMAYENTER